MSAKDLALLLQSLHNQDDHANRIFGSFAIFPSLKSTHGQNFDKPNMLFIKDFLFYHSENPCRNKTPFYQMWLVCHRFSY